MNNHINENRRYIIGYTLFEFHRLHHHHYVSLRQSVVGILFRACLSFSSYSDLLLTIIRTNAILTWKERLRVQEKKIGEKEGGEEGKNFSSYIVYVSLSSTKEEKEKSFELHILRLYTTFISVCVRIYVHIYIYIHINSLFVLITVIYISRWLQLAAK